MTDFSVPLSVFLSLPSVFSIFASLPLYPWCFFLFCLFTSLCHELTSFFLISLCFFLHVPPFFFLICSLSVPLLPPVILSVLWNQCSPIRIHSSLSYFTLQPHLSGSSSLPRLVFALYSHFSSFGILRALLLILVSRLLLLFLPFSSSGRWSFHFQRAHLFFLGRFGSHTELSFPRLAFQVFFASLLSAKQRDQALEES